MLVNNTLLIKIYVNEIMLFCFMSGMLCWFANREHRHLKIEFYSNKKGCFKIAGTFFEALICNCLVPSYYTT